MEFVAVADSCSHYFVDVVDHKLLSFAFLMAVAVVVAVVVDFLATVADTIINDAK